MEGSPIRKPLSPRLRSLRGLAALALAVVLCVVAWRGWSGWSERASGQALYEGRHPLTAQLAGHDAPLPADAVRCMNCHRARQGDDEAATFGATLTSGALSRVQARRGGPPSRYDAAALCRLLRTGVDPAWVVINTTMPRYTLSDAECEQLWLYIEKS